MSRDYDTSDPEAVSREERRISLRQRQNLDDLKGVLSSRPGRRWVMRLLDSCRVLQSIWDSSSRIHYLAGRQDVGQELLSAILNLDPNIYLDMLREKKEDESDG